MTYTEYISRLDKLRDIWKTKDSPPSKIKSPIQFKEWDLDMEVSVRKPCRDLFNEWLNA